MILMPSQSVRTRRVLGQALTLALWTECSCPPKPSVGLSPAEHWGAPVIWSSAGHVRSELQSARSHYGCGTAWQKTEGGRHLGAAWLGALAGCHIDSSPGFSSHPDRPAPSVQDSGEDQTITCVPAWHTVCVINGSYYLVAVLDLSWAQHLRDLLHGT